MRLLTLSIAAMLVSGCGQVPSKPNQRTPSTSPSGQFVLTVPIEKDPKLQLGFWRVTISDAAGKMLYKDDSYFNGWLKVYWCWDNADRVWLYNSDDGKTHIWQVSYGQWQRTLLTPGNPLTPPPDLYPDYVKKLRAQPVS